MMPAPFRPETSALVLIDHQVGTMQLIKTLDLADVRRFTLALAKAAKILGMPVVLTSSQEDRIQQPLMPELAELLPEAYAARVKRAGIVNAWDDPNFRAAIERTGRKQLIMGGVTTDVCPGCSRSRPSTQPDHLGPETHVKAGVHHTATSNQGIAAGVANSIPRGPIPNEGNPR